MRRIQGRWIDRRRPGPGSAGGDEAAGTPSLAADRRVYGFQAGSASLPTISVGSLRRVTSQTLYALPASN